ncbi:MAG: NADH-quinone oxidoreductase subunit N [Planctomycetes bacterium]|nr:NADH-quinone oxidoreductase subunit N [Planctomycetota bacterium]
MTNPFPLEEVRCILPVLLLFAAATAVLIADLFLRGWNEPASGPPKRLLPMLSILGAGAAGFFLWRDWGSAPAVVFHGALRADAFAHAMTAIILLGTLLTLVTTAAYLRRHGTEHGEFYALILYAAGGMALFAAANNLIVLFVSLETFSLAVYILAGYFRDEKRAVEGALKYFIMGGLASGFLLLGLAFLFGASGTIRLDDLGRSPIDQPLFLAGLGLSMTGFGFKVGVFPFHSWIPDAYEGAPTLVTGFMSVTVKTAGFAALVRFVLELSRQAEAGPALAQVLAWLSAGTMIFGNAVALVQGSVKRMLAYSAISHTGYLLIGLVAAIAPERGGSSAPVVFYLLSYTLMTFGAFAVLGSIGQDGPENETFEAFHGLSQRRPLLAFAMLVFMISLAGIPPTAGFWGKLYLFREAVYAGYWPLALVGILTSIVSVYYYLRLVVVMYMQPAGEGASAAPAPGWGAALATAAAAAAVIAIGFFPQTLLDQSVASIQAAFGAR